METGKILAKHFIELTDDVFTRLEYPTKKFTTENFHQLRVNIKKIKALFKLVESGPKNFKFKKYFKPFKLLFDEAGTIRELQLEKLFLKKQTGHLRNHSYLHAIQKRIEEGKEKFFSMIPGQLAKLKNVVERVSSFIHSLSNDEIEIYLQRKSADINTILGKSKLVMGDIHELRKQLKTHSYNLKSLERKKSSSWLKKTDAFQEMAGSWHDKRVMSQHFKRATKRFVMTEDEIAVLKTLELKLDADAKNLLYEMNDFSRPW